MAQPNVIRELSNLLMKDTADTFLRANLQGAAPAVVYLINTAKVRLHLYMLSTGQHRSYSPDEIGTVRQGKTLQKFYRHSYNVYRNNLAALSRHTTLFDCRCYPVRLYRHFFLSVKVSSTLPLLPAGKRFFLGLISAAESLRCAG